MEPTPTPNSPTPAPEPTPAPQPTPANPAPTLLSQPAPTPTPAPGAPEMPAAFEGGADAWAKLDDAGKTAALTAATEKAAGESKARVDAWKGATDKDAQLKAYEALTKDEKVEAFKALTDDQKKDLGLSDPARPTYTEFKLPEGVKLDPERAKAATELFADTNLTQEQAQKFMDMHVAELTAMQNQNVQAFVDLQNKWVSEIKADPEIGGDKLTASLASAARAIDRLDVPGLREALTLTGAGNHPAIVKGFVRLGQMVSEDRFAPGRDIRSEVPKSPAEVIYDGQPKA